MRRQKTLVFLCFLILFQMHILGRNNTRVCLISEFNGLSHHHCTSIAEDANGVLWIGTWNGLNRFDGSDFVAFKSHPGDGSTLEYDRIKDIRVIGYKILCLVEDECFIFDIRTGKFHDANITWHQALIRYHLPQAPVRTLIDKQGTKWTATQKGLIHEYKYTAYEQRIPQRSDSQGRCIFRDNKQRIWITNREEPTIRIFDSKLNLKGYLGKDGHLHSGYTTFRSAVYCILQDAQGNYWLGTKPGHLYLLQEKKENIFSIEHITQDLWGHKTGAEIYDIKQDRWGRLWLATMDNSLNCILNPHSKTRRILSDFRNKTNIPSECKSMRYIYITPDDRMILCSSRGLLVSKLTPKSPYQIRFNVHKREAHRGNSLSNSATMFAMEDSRHNIYICTEGGGINRILTKNLLAKRLSFEHYYESYVSSAFEDNGTLWFIGTKELIALNSKTQSIVTYNNDVWEDKLLFSDAHPLPLGNGKYILGLMDGVTIFDINALHRRSFVPKIVLSSVVIENNLVDYAVSSKDTIILDKNQRNVKVSFTALDFINNNNIHYRFKIGRENKWNDLNNIHSVTLLNLDPGTYDLFLESKQLNGEWAGNTRKITIIVTPTIWQTTIAKVLYVILALLTISSIVSTYLYIRKIQNKQAETLEAYLSLMKEKEHVTEKQDNSVALTQNSISTEDKVFMDRIINYVNEHLDDADINVNDLADAVGVSKSCLTRKMKKIVGVTPKYFINKARMQKACDLLNTTNLTVKEIAYDCGFADQNYFGKSFRIVYGMSPSEYRHQNRG